MGAGAYKFRLCDVTEIALALPPSIKNFIEKVPINNKKSRKKKICRAKLLMYSILHYITNCLNFNSISTTKKNIETTTKKKKMSAQ